MIYDLIIVGAGAAGLTAAYKAILANRQLNILVLEKEKLPGRKLSAAGNGKCNVTNAYYDDTCYRTNNKECLKGFLYENAYQEILDFFAELGIVLYQNNGYYYPVSNQAKQVTNMLFQKSKETGVTYHFEERVTDINYTQKNGQDLYEISTKGSLEHTKYLAKFLLLATGGAANMKLGGCKDGYLLADQLHLKQRERFPVLSPIYVKDDNLKIAKGIRLDATVTLKKESDIILKENGQVQFNENSLSGIVIMNLSGTLNEWKEQIPKDCLYLDVVPTLSWEELKDFISANKIGFEHQTILDLLNGILCAKFNEYLLKRLHIDKACLAGSLTDKQINKLVSNLKKLTYTPVFMYDYEKAQATGGGVLLTELKDNSFECKNCDNVFVVGEVLDVQGKCGGYNITFAMRSALSATKEIIKRLEDK